MDNSAPGDNNSPSGSGQDLNPNPNPNSSMGSVWSQPAEPVSGTQPSGQSDQGPILPGQFVITGEDNKAENPSPVSPTASSPFSQPIPPSSPEPSAPTLPPLESSLPPISPLPFSIPDPAAENGTGNLMTQNPPASSPAAPAIDASSPLPPPVPPGPNLAGQAAPIPDPVTSASQPDPTPFASPPASTSSGFSKGPGSGIKKIRIMLIVVGVIVLMVIIGAVAWFFLIGSKTNEAATSSQADQAQTGTIDQQPPIPPRTQGGFNEIDEVTSTPSGQTQESTPAASSLPTP